MLRILVGVSIAAALVVFIVPAQGQTASDLASATPQENASSSAVNQRAPGTWVRGAIARHTGLKGLRLTGPRFGQPNTEEADLRFGTGTGTTSTTDGLGGLLDLLNQVGGLGELGNLVGGLTGGTTGGTDTTGGTNYTLADLIALGQSVGATSKSITADATSEAGGGATTKVGATTQTRYGRTYGGAIARLPKPEERYQTSTTTTETTSFKTRWANAMAQTFFSAVALGFQSTAFIELLKDSLRPLVLPQSQTDTNSNTDGSNTTNGGIEDLSPPDEDDGDGGSSI
jgi:hypothetical protein